MKKQIAILGSTGSIGTQALQVIEEHPDRYEAYVLTANNRVEDLIAQARKFKPEAVVIANETKYQQLKDALADLPIKVYAGVLILSGGTCWLKLWLKQKQIPRNWLCVRFLIMR